jgi:hypothetical protein
MNVCAIFFGTLLTSFILGPLLRILQFVMKDFCLSPNSFPVALNAAVVFYFTISKGLSAPVYGGRKLLRKVGTVN